MRENYIFTFLRHPNDTEPANTDIIDIIINSCYLTTLFKLQSFYCVESGEYRWWSFGLLRSLIFWLHVKVSEEHSASIFRDDVRRAEQSISLPALLFLVSRPDVG
jgi:hypothetical protein